MSKELPLPYSKRISPVVNRSERLWFHFQSKGSTWRLLKDSVFILSLQIFAMLPFAEYK